MKPLAQALAKEISERDFQDAVIQYAKLHRWRITHFRPAMNRRGKWATPLAGDSGYPDLTLVRGNRLVFAELKREGGKLTADQRAWLEALGAVNGVEVFCWTPSDWPAIEKILGPDQPALPEFVEYPEDSHRMETIRSREVLG